MCQRLHWVAVMVRSFHQEHKTFKKLRLTKLSSSYWPYWMPKVTPRNHKSYWSSITILRSYIWQSRLAQGRRVMMRMISLPSLTLACFGRYNSWTSCRLRSPTKAKATSNSWWKTSSLSSGKAVSDSKKAVEGRRNKSYCQRRSRSRSLTVLQASSTSLVISSTRSSWSNAYPLRWQTHFPPRRWNRSHFSSFWKSLNRTHMIIGWSLILRRVLATRNRKERKRLKTHNCCFWARSWPSFCNSSIASRMKDGRQDKLPHMASRSS